MYLLKFYAYKAPKNVTLRADGCNDTGSGKLQVCENKIVKLFCINLPSNPPVQKYKIIENSITVSNVSLVFLFDIFWTKHFSLQN